MHFLNPKARIALGLVGIMSSLVMLCFSFNIIPDRSAAQYGMDGLHWQNRLQSTARLR